MRAKKISAGRQKGLDAANEKRRYLTQLKNIDLSPEEVDLLTAKREAKARALRRSRQNSKAKDNAGIPRPASASGRTALTADKADARGQLDGILVLVSRRPPTDCKMPDSLEDLQMIIKEEVPTITARELFVFLYFSTLWTMVAMSLTAAGSIEQMVSDAQFKLVDGVLSMAMCWVCGFPIGLLDSTAAIVGSEFMDAIHKLFHCAPVQVIKGAGLAVVLEAQRGDGRICSSTHVGHPVPAADGSRSSMSGKPLSNLGWKYDFGSSARPVCIYQLARLFQCCQLLHAAFTRGSVADSGHALWDVEWAAGWPVVVGYIPSSPASTCQGSRPSHWAWMESAAQATAWVTREL